jgi:hypothetical protein
MNKLILILNTIYVLIVSIEESGVVELLPFESSVKIKIKGVTLCLMVLLNAFLIKVKPKENI